MKHHRLPTDDIDVLFRDGLRQIAVPFRNETYVRQSQWQRLRSRIEQFTAFDVRVSHPRFVPYADVWAFQSIAVRWYIPELYVMRCLRALS